MAAAVSFAVLFLLSPVVGYWVLASRLPLRTKIRIAIADMAFLVLAPLVVVVISSV